MADNPHPPADVVPADRPEAPFWLLHSLASEVEQRLCESGSDMDCSDRDLNVTEFCNPCAARWWMRGVRALAALDQPPATPSSAALAIDTSLTDKARALHRVCRALNDGDCPKCHQMHAASEIIRDTRDPVAVLVKRIEPGISCPSCRFKITYAEIREIERLFAPAMNGAVAIFESWRKDRNHE